MADVLIRGMEMPENCGNCFFCDDWAKCQLLNLNNIFDYCKDGIERPAKCPLVPLPERHGRLIDADAFLAAMRPLCKEDAQAACTLETAKQLIYLAISSAPTVIPVEGDGEE